MTAKAVLFDFGGVLTTSVYGAFREFGRDVCGDEKLPLRVLAQDADASAALVAHEEGRTDAAAFEAGYAAALGRAGVEVPADGLLDNLQRRMTRDEDTVALVAELRADGVAVGLLSNSLGDCYAGYDLAGMFDAITISGQIGSRKPSRRSFEIGCERLGHSPSDVVMVDDLDQNIVAAKRFGMHGVLHSNAVDTRRELTSLLGTQPA